MKRFALPLLISAVIALMLPRRWGLRAILAVVLGVLCLLWVVALMLRPFFRFYWPKGA